MKIITVVGARPQFIKALSVSKSIRKKHKELLIHTGQHYDYNMSDIFFSEMGIPIPDYNLHIGSGSHGKMTGEMLVKLEDIYIKERPDAVLVYGDTNSTLAGALAASKLLIPVIHVEAGLRSFNKAMPEEQNRVITDHLSKLLFTPTLCAEKNLRKEGITQGIHNVGDVMYDTVLMFREKAGEKRPFFNNIGCSRGEYILTTIHRAENINNIGRLNEIIKAINECDKKVILPLHPGTRKLAESYGLKFNDNVKVIEPVGYLEMLILEKNSSKIVTDSGGVQKEAYFMGKPCITMRNETEWIETVEAGWNIVVGADKDRILNAVENFTPLHKQSNIFGDGKASEKIAALVEELN